MNIVFDFGAVVFKWQPDQILAQRFPDRAATQAEAKTLAADVFQHPDWHAYDQGLFETGEIVDRTARRLGLDAGRLGNLVDEIPELLTPIEGTVRILRAFGQRREADSRIRLYYLSNMPAPVARELERRHGFLSVFDGGIFSGDVKLIKPQPEIFKLTAERYQLRGDQTVFIDDIRSNVEAARAFGWQALQFVSTAQLQIELDTLLRGFSGIGSRQ